MKSFQFFYIKLIITLALIEAGCVSPPPPPSSVTRIKLDRVNSSIVRVERIRFALEEGQLFLVGDVTKIAGPRDTMETHLDVVLKDAKGEILRKITGRFKPQRIPHGHRMQGHSRFQVPIDSLPTNAVEIEVCAHEGDH